MDPLDARCLDSMGLLTGTPSPPHIVPRGTIMPRDRRVFLQRATQPTAPPVVHPPSAMQDEIHDMHDRLHSMEANISEILSYLHPGSSFQTQLFPFPLQLKNRNSFSHLLILLNSTIPPKNHPTSVDLPPISTVHRRPY
ncbi:hypothetical protein V6N12_045250 [Hibiscus sabdariffa]|uniref:Uncharacterized protein n=1 Tax=Hibiscus sabdariffa TaxID=183260 RepID=A0ABR2G274_9ROSI